MPSITEHIRLEPYDKDGKGTGVFYEFQVNPNKLDIASEVQVVESQFLRQDGGIVRPTQVKLRKINGSGKFFDIPFGTEDNFALVSRGKHSAFDMYSDLEMYMKLKMVMRFSHQYFGNIYVIIQSLSISNTPSDNSVDFTFTFSETMIDNSRTGFERDKNKQVPGMAVSANTTIQYDTYVVKSGDTLSKIALKFYGNASKWGIIYDYNLSILINGPNVLKVGWVLKIPKSDSVPRKTTGGVKPKTTYTSPGPTTEELAATSFVYSNLPWLKQGFSTSNTAIATAYAKIIKGGYAYGLKNSTNKTSLQCAPNAWTQSKYLNP